VTNVTSCLPWENFPDCLGKISQVPCVDFPSVLWFSRSFSPNALAIFPECLGEISPSTLGAVLWFFPSVLWFFPACFSFSQRALGIFPALGKFPSLGKTALTMGKKKLVTLLDLCVSSLRRGHANLLCIVPILTDGNLRRGSKLYYPRHLGT
jgi:hypothetical protein